MKVVIVSLLDLWLPTPITTNVVSSKSRSDKVYSIQHDVINCQWFAAGRWFSPGTQVSSTNKTDCHDTTEILLKVALNTMTLNPKVLGHLQTYQSSPLEPLDQFKPGWNVDLMSLNYIQNLDKENDISKLKFSNLWFWLLCCLFDLFKLPSCSVS